MDTPKSNLIGALENFWNGWATARREKDIILIVCGSATSWISKKLLKDKGALRGRLTNRIKVVPFTLHECELFAKSKNLALARKDILHLYMIIGGIPYYWSFLRRGLSVAQNVDQLFFMETAQLHDEFEALYAILFKRPQNYLKVIQCMSDGRKSGMTRDEILLACKLSDGGSFSSIMEEVEECGFILGISGVQTNVCSWFTRGTGQRHGAQIDLVIQRADGFTDLCEIKHSQDVFTIDQACASDLTNKLEAYQDLSKDNRTPHLVMVTTRGVAHNAHYNIIQNEITLDYLFAGQCY